MDKFGPDIRREDLTIMASKMVGAGAGGAVGVGASAKGGCPQRSGAAATAAHPHLLHVFWSACSNPVYPFLYLQDDPTEQIFVFFPDEPKVRRLGGVGGLPQRAVEASSASLLLAFLSARCRHHLEV